MLESAHGLINPVSYIAGKYARTLADKAPDIYFNFRDNAQREPFNAGYHFGTSVASAVAVATAGPLVFSAGTKVVSNVARSGINSYRIGTDVVKNVYASSKVGTASVLEKTSLLYSSGAQRVKNLWFEKPIVHLHDAHVLDYANTYVNHNRVRLSIDGKLTKQKIIEYLHNVEDIPREQLLISLESIGLQYIGGSPDGINLSFGRLQQECVINKIAITLKNEIRIRIDGPHLKGLNGFKKEHMHIFNSELRPLDKYLKQVLRESSEAHISIKPLKTTLDFKPV